jgi:hypothetical protein
VESDESHREHIEKQELYYPYVPYPEFAAPALRVIDRRFHQGFA